MAISQFIVGVQDAFHKTSQPIFERSIVELSAWLVLGVILFVSFGHSNFKIYSYISYHHPRLNLFDQIINVMEFFIHASTVFISLLVYSSTTQH
jgi:hypothetical protein